MVYQSRPLFLFNSYYAPTCPADTLLRAIPNELLNIIAIIKNYIIDFINPYIIISRVVTISDHIKSIIVK